MVRPASVFRFAPSPNGYLHRGHAVSALLNACLADHFGGTFLLRFEDIDPVRSRAEFYAAIEEDLDWLQLDWQKPVRRQSEHMDDYARAFRALEAADLVYPCFCTRRDVAMAIAARADAAEWPQDPDSAPLYPGTCRALSQTGIAQRLAAGHVPQARLRMDRALAVSGVTAYRSFDPESGAEYETRCDPARWGDVVIVRRDTPTSYHLSVVVDDAIQSVSHIVRGADLEAATDIHAVLQALLHLPRPAYWHHGLLLDAQGEKLAKTRKSLSLRDERIAGLTRDALIASLRRDPRFARLLDFENEKPEGGRKNRQAG